MPPWRAPCSTASLAFGGMMASPDSAQGVSLQVQGWIRQIRKEQAAGLDLETASAEARLSFEAQLGQLLSAAQQHDWNAAQAEIRRADEAGQRLAAPHALRNPRRSNWYQGPSPDDANWPPLRAYLLGRRGWSEETVGGLDAMSTEVVSLSEDPRQSAFRGRGMVVGYVQSGKTANMLAVIAKAVDAGYRFIIILAGLTNALRRQTQGRFETDLRARNQLGWHLHTSYEDAGDFQTPPNLWFSLMDQAQVAIIKKNVTPLKRLIRTIEKTPPALREQMPVLIIDDECDQASVNASGSQFDTTAINGAIRTLLSRLPRVQYIGYTATPFANVLINPRTPKGLLDDLYPEDFICALPHPHGYSGAETLFGLPAADAGDETESETGLDMIREVPEADVPAVRPASAKGRADFSASIPESLDLALTYFVLGTAARRARGQVREHSSMLVHTTVYTRAHESLAAEIREWVRATTGRIGDPSFRSELAAGWLEEQDRIDAARRTRPAVSFESLEPFLGEVLGALEVVVENSASDTRLSFDAGPRTYVVVGGSVLARGLTIEGLLVSYFVRSASQYDTLLQMGRWFGFRPGYEDLPRIWMTADLASSFRELAGVEEELRDDIAEYVRQDLTPADLAVRIRQIPSLSITAANKMFAAEACDVSFSGEHLQTIRFQHHDRDRLARNWTAGQVLVAAAPHGIEQRPQGRLLRGVPLHRVKAFLGAYAASPLDRFADGLSRYLDSEAEAEDGAFALWDIGVIEPASGAFTSQELGAFGPVRLVNRSRLSLPRTDGGADIKALMSRRDILLDATTPFSGADEWEAIKRHRQQEVGDLTPLLLLYAIDPQSRPRNESRYRAPLEAAGEMLGVGLVLPDRGVRKQYVRVRLEHDDAGEDMLADLPAEELT